MRVLMISESVPPQVNGMARRIGHYAEGLEKLGCKVTLLDPDSDSSAVWGFANPWNFAARMMVVRPGHFLSLLSGSVFGGITPDFDVVHAVMPLNLSSVWLLAGFRLLRGLLGQEAPVLIVSWHCNLEAFNATIFPNIVQPFMKRACYCAFIPIAQLADRLLIPTPSTEPLIREAFGERWGIAANGLMLSSFNPNARFSPSGVEWERRKRETLANTGCTHLLLTVGRLSPEKGVADLVEALPHMPGCALWLVGDGPARPSLEALAAAGVSGSGPLPVVFWGYQHGEALSAVYTVCDCFVCPSQTETFGQTVNEALASGVPVAVPRVGCFADAYDGILSGDQFWKPGDGRDLATTVLRQLSPPAASCGSTVPAEPAEPAEPADPAEPPSSGDERTPPPSPTPVRPPPLKLKSWATACEELLTEYREVDVAAMRRRSSRARRYAKGTLVTVMYPAFWLLTAVMTLAVIVLCLLRTAVGGVSVRSFCRAKATRAKQVGLGLLRKPSFLDMPIFESADTIAASKGDSRAPAVAQRKLHAA